MIGKKIGLVLDSVHRYLGKSALAARLAVKLENQANAVIRARMNDGIHFSDNGEEWLLGCLSAIRVAVDVGANKGQWSRAVLKTASDSLVQLIAFEPSKSSHAWLVHDLADEISRNLVFVSDSAISDWIGESVFYADEVAGERASLGSRSSVENNRKYSVNVSTLDFELARYGVKQVDILKIDTEGFDGRVLLGAKGLLERLGIDVIQFEYNKPWIEAGNSLRQIIDLLERYGYEVYLLKKNGLYIYPYNVYGEFFGYANFCALSPNIRHKFALFIRGCI